MDFIEEKFEEFELLIFDNLDGFASKDFSLLLEKLPKDYKKRTKRVLSDEKKKLKVIEYFMVKKLLGIKSQKDFSYNKNGKPFIPGEKYFNISNSEGVACVAASKREIGIDIQKCFEFKQKLADFICNDDELVELKKSDDKGKLLTKFFAQKESFLKCFGLNLSYDFKVFDYSKVDFVFLEHGDYMISICLKK